MIRGGSKRRLDSPGTDAIFCITLFQQKADTAVTRKTPEPRRRGRRPAPEDERKDRVIQARVPEELETTLKQAAEKRRMTVSHLIRNVLEDTFTLVDNIVADSSALVEQVSRDARRVAASVRGEEPARPHSKEALMESIDAWQEVIVNKPGHCLQCDVALKRGQKAYRGISPLQATVPAWLCTQCLEQL